MPGERTSDIIKNYWLAVFAPLFAAKKWKRKIIKKFIYLRF